VGALLFERGVYATLAFYPGVPRQEVGFRLQVTAANTGDQIDELLVVLDELADREVMRPAFP
jgi:8-amino-7-oxononanoate synthase